MAVCVAGLLAAAPFLTNRPMGTSEAYNYSLSLADTVTQLRHGTFPVLAGQTEFAFNGRVHPLRTAPYLNYMAGFLDLITVRQLGFWALQNLVLALSLIGGALACFWSLRRVTPATYETAASLAALYVFSPPVLAAAYGMDLYMTVTTVPFVPIALAMCVAAFAERKPTDLLKLVCALAACWLAHPPVAFWLSVAVLLLQVMAACLRPPRLRELPLFLGMGLLFCVLAGFCFASALTIAPYQDVARVHDLSQLFIEVSRAFPLSFNPVSLTANQIGDFQLGYVIWGLLAIATALSLLHRNYQSLALLSVASLFYAFTAPIPVVNHWLWTHAPSVAFNVTNQWPMQRLYLPITMLILMAFAIVWREPKPTTTAARDSLRLTLVVAILWTGWQGSRFIGRAFSTQQVAIQHGHASGNINLTQISYALLGTPSSFSSGVMDPAFEFRLLAAYDAHELDSNWKVNLPAFADNQRGVFEAIPGNNSTVLQLSPKLTLKPGAHYKLTFKFLAPPNEATLQVLGPTMFRQYPLPSSGGPRGFGMLIGNNPSLTLWTAQKNQEEITLRVVGPGLANGQWARSRFAEYTLELIEPTVLPIVLESLLPLKAKVKSPAASYLETPRLYIPGYEAEVNGSHVRVQRSPDGLAMIPVPAGASQVVMRYTGPQVTRMAFWIGCVGWLGVALGVLIFTFYPKLLGRLSGFFILSNRMKWTLAASILLLASGIWSWGKWSDYRHAIGPVRIRFVLPRGETNRQQPLLVTGQPHAGTFVYVIYHDTEHIRIGVDVWGILGYQSEPIRADYFAEHEVVVDAGSLYATNHPLLGKLSEKALKNLRSRLRVEFDGTTVVEREVDTHPSKPAEVTIGRNLIGGSSCEPNFAGQILSVERLKSNW